MRTLEIYRNGVLAGQLIEENPNQFSFRYDLRYLRNEKNPAISLTLPKTEEKFKSTLLFPFFFNMLSEGVNRKLQSLYLRIDENDHFGLLAATAQTDTIGAITVKLI